MPSVISASNSSSLSRWSLSFAGCRWLLSTKSAKAAFARDCVCLSPWTAAGARPRTPSVGDDVRNIVGLRRGGPHANEEFSEKRRTLHDISAGYRKLVSIVIEGAL